MRAIQQIDKDIALNMRLLRNLAERSFSYRLQTFIHWGEAREAYPILDAIDEDLYRERYDAQVAEDKKAVRAAKSAEKKNASAYRVQRANTCIACGATL